MALFVKKIDKEKKKKYIALLPHQKKFAIETVDKQLVALVGGYGSGKTEALMYRTINFIKQAKKCIKSGKMQKYVIALYEPTYDLIKQILIKDKFEAFFSQNKIEYKLNKSDYIFSLYNGKIEIIMRSMSNPERIVGFETHDCIIDELDTLSATKAQDVFEKIIGRNRAKKPKSFNNGLNTVGITTTPEGFRFVYKKFVKEKESPQKILIKAKTIDNKFLPKTYIQNLIENYPKEQLKAYLNGEFVNLNNKPVYYKFKREKYVKNIDILSLISPKNVVIGMDFNIEKMAIVVGVLVNNHLFIIESKNDLLDTPAAIQYIKENYSYLEEIIIYPDSAGNQRTTTGASKTDIKLLKEAGFIVKAKKTNPLIKDRVLVVNNNFEKNNITITYPDKNESLISSLEQQVLKNGQPDKTQGFDHILDAFGYLVYGIFGKKLEMFKATYNKK